MRQIHKAVGRQGRGSGFPSITPNAAAAPQFPCLKVSLYTFGSVKSPPEKKHRRWNFAPWSALEIVGAGNNLEALDWIGKFAFLGGTAWKQRGK
jgi:hypothetical protein